MCFDEGFALTIKYNFFFATTNIDSFKFYLTFIQHSVLPLTRPQQNKLEAALKNFIYFVLLYHISFHFIPVHSHTATHSYLWMHSLSADCWHLLLLLFTGSVDIFYYTYTHGARAGERNLFKRDSFLVWHNIFWLNLKISDPASMFCFRVVYIKAIFSFFLDADAVLNVTIIAGL